ncbi:TPA: hypothetical protein N0F65_009581 [Lagenidium giganteum]|uniref:MULE transposase domain-containing protein n=1 Tax=Lagenidium giganteum TaxID=4803 RepID=A0AAV2YL95_9STRA|nr:TPA: hypothetical protein N0F65_009581 [Lagenidium giganteum]
MINIFRSSASELPTLRQIQSVSTHHKKKRMASEDDTDLFVFGFKNDQLGRPLVGRGSDEDPFLLGVPSKRLLRHLDALMDTFVFHVFATFKLSSLGYPVLVCGVSDVIRHFHPVALFIMSQQTEDLYREALYALRTTFAAANRKSNDRSLRHG